MLCSTASSKFVCSCISVIKYTKVKALTSDNFSTTVSKRAFLDLNEKEKCWPLLFFTILKLHKSVSIIENYEKKVWYVMFEILCFFFSF